MLARAATRGEGVRGEGVTANVRTIAAVPLRLSDREAKVPPFLALRAEVILRIADFEAVNARLLEEGKAPFANPRNAVAGTLTALPPRATPRNAPAGTLRHLDPPVPASRPLDLYVYYAPAARGLRLGIHRDTLA